MSSPFPGMNPYLEQEDAWNDFHERFIPAAAEEIGRQVEPAYIVKIEQNVYVHEFPDEGRTLLGRPDAFVAQSRGDLSSKGTAASLDAPAVTQLSAAIITERQSFLEIRDRAGRKLVTAIELLSPSNKRPGSDRQQYLHKRKQYAESGVHLVEIDLLRGGPRMPLVPLPPCDYYVVVCRAEKRRDEGIWPIRLRDPLPTIPIPLHTGDADAALDLQALLHRVYDAAGYRHYIYDSPPEPPLPAEDAAWVEATASTRGI